MTIVRTKIKGELFTHRVLWECCQRQLEAAETARMNKTGPLYFELAAMLMAYLTYEAYINFLGDRLAPEIWKDERNYFNTDPYRGIEGKLKKIAEICNIKDIQKGERPYQTIIELNTLRNYLAHAKPDKYEKVIEHSRENEPTLFHPELDQLVTPEKAKLAIDDVQAFVEYLHAEASSHVDDIWFGDEALEGPSQHSEGDTTAKT